MTISALLQHPLNPLNSLFVKIFLWFWVTALVLMLGVATSMRQFLEWMEPVPATPEQVQRLEKIATKVQRMVNRRGGRIGPGLLRRNQVLLWDQADEVRAPPPVRERFLVIAKEFAKEDFIQQKYSDGFLFIGPKAIEIKSSFKNEESAQQLFLFRKAKRKNPIFSPGSGGLRLRAFLYILGSGLASFFLAWTITRRLRQLRAVTGQLRAGDFSARLPAPRYFLDEIDRLSLDYNAMAEHISLLITSQQSLLQMTSHELRSPLTRIGVALGIAQQSGDTTACLSRIEKEIDYLDRLLSEILRLAALDSDQKIRSAKVLPLLPIVERVLDNAKFATQGKREINLVDTIAMTATKPQVLMEENLLYLALENIVNNALKYSPESKPVSVRVESSEWRDVVIRVIDQGEGVDPEFLAKMFEPFTRKNYSSDGFGLGLAITKRIVEALDGSVKAAPGKTGGFEVSLTLPRKEPV